MALWDVNHQITSGTVVRYLNDTYIDIIHIGSNCTEIFYTAIMDSSAVDFVLNTILPSIDLGTLTVPISILSCPIGFTYTHGICTCSSSIIAENVTCDIDTLQNLISHKGQLWIGPYNTSITINASQPNDHNVCFINEQCLLCNPSIV